MKTKLLALVVVAVVASSIMAIDLASDYSNAENTAFDLSEHVGDYWKYDNYGTTSYSEYATILMSNDNYQLVVGSDTYTISTESTTTAESVKFSIQKDGSDAGSIAFPVVTDNNLTGRMDVTLNNSTQPCFLEGDISISGIEGFTFQPSTLYDAITLFPNNAAAGHYKTNGMIITIPSGDYAIGKINAGDNIMFSNNFADTLTIKAEQGSKVNVYITNIEFYHIGTNTSNNNVKVEGLNFITERAVGGSFGMNNFDTAEVVDCSFEGVMLRALNNSTLLVSGNTFNGTGETVTDPADHELKMAMMVNENTNVTVKNNTVNDYVTGVSISSWMTISGMQVNIEDNTLSNLTGEDSAGVIINSHMEGAKITVSGNDVSGAKYGVAISDSVNSDSDTEVRSSENTYRGCQSAFMYFANDSGDVASVKLVSDKDSAYDETGSPMDVIAISESGGSLSGVVSIENPLTEEEFVPPSWDDDDELPPFIPTQPTDDDDDTVTIVACAAAAAVAAIMAVFLIIDRKG